MVHALAEPPQGGGIDVTARGFATSGKRSPKGGGRARPRPALTTAGSWPRHEPHSWLAFRPLPHAVTRGCGWRGRRCRHPRLPHPASRGGREEGKKRSRRRRRRNSWRKRGMRSSWRRCEPGMWERATDAYGRTFFRHRLCGRAHWTLSAGASCGGKRKKKKRRRRRRTRCSRSSCSCASSWRRRARTVGPEADCRGTQSNEFVPELGSA